MAAPARALYVLLESPQKLCGISRDIGSLPTAQFPYGRFFFCFTLLCSFATTLWRFLHPSENHIGHAKSILLNSGLAKKYGGEFNLRFDDTNPTKEKLEFVESIKEDVKWLGADWGDRLFFASNYFDQMYEAAIKLIKKGKSICIRSVCRRNP